jgi:beta-lactam-binding protein with PASTA domain
MPLFNKDTKIYIASIIPFISFFLGYYTIDNILFRNRAQVPNVVGLYIYDAIKKLSEYKLNARILYEKEDYGMPEGIILDQNPTSESIVKPNQSVFLTITRKPNPIYAPNLYNLDINDIDKLISKDIEIKKYPLELNDYPSNIIIAQSIEPYDKINKPLYIYYTIKKKIFIYYAIIL